MSKKEIAKDFLQLCAKGDSRLAFEKYVGSNFKHHNAYFKGDANTLMLAMEYAAKEFPNTNLEIQRLLEDDDLVAVHSKIQHDKNSPEMAVMHILRFGHNKIAELWDFGQEVPADMPNENGMF